MRARKKKPKQNKTRQCQARNWFLLLIYTIPWILIWKCELQWFISLSTQRSLWHGDTVSHARYVILSCQHTGLSVMVPLCYTLDIIFRHVNTKVSQSWWHCVTRSISYSVMSTQRSLGHGDTVLHTRYHILSERSTMLSAATDLICNSDFIQRDVFDATFEITSMSNSFNDLNTIYSKDGSNNQHLYTLKISFYSSLNNIDCI